MKKLTKNLFLLIFVFMSIWFLVNSAKNNSKIIPDLQPDSEVAFSSYVNIEQSESIETLENEVICFFGNYFKVAETRKIAKIFFFVLFVPIGIKVHAQYPRGTLVNIQK